MKIMTFSRTPASVRLTRLCDYFLLPPCLRRSRSLPLSLQVSVCLLFPIWKQMTTFCTEEQNRRFLPWIYRWQKKLASALSTSLFPSTEQSIFQSALIFSIAGFQNVITRLLSGLPVSRPGKRDIIHCGEAIFKSCVSPFQAQFLREATPIRSGKRGLATGGVGE